MYTGSVHMIVTESKILGLYSIFYQENVLVRIDFKISILHIFHIIVILRMALYDLLRDQYVC